MEDIKTRLIHLVALCADYCSLLENAGSMERAELTGALLGCLPRIYFEFHDIEAGDSVALDEWGMGALQEHLDEDSYESVRRQLAAVIGEDDTYLETFHRDMKYSDTPIAVTVSENLCDIYQPLFNFVMETRESGGDNLEAAYSECRDGFKDYWSQTLCNVMRALNAMHYEL